ncbi:alpha/beta hydrolase [Hydrogenibacillus sp. N12]|uniref:alpha/beta hydrolase n=1 Tax=Hydrogenibacillus sp. N12 TaxID=2866627 RepID=UPI001C7CDEF2|nr:alpha/beta hydrolase [Hydrogenibacillus sp. N12]QZA32148.1 alpha/beta hydrolase [Hydrogenibacillus sp. N12]
MVAAASGRYDGDTIKAHHVVTNRLRQHIREAGSPDGIPVVFVHGNLSTGRFWEDTMRALGPRYRAIAPDLRGFGGTDPKPIDATRGLRDFTDDLHGLLETLGLAGRPGGVHFVGWSAGGAVAMQYAIDHPREVASLVLVNPMSPYGFGGTRDTEGTPCWPDFAGSGAGTANPEFVRLLADGERGAEHPLAPRNMLNNFYFKPPFRASPNDEEDFLDAILSARTGEDFYPGDVTASANWPGVAPGTRGMNNAISPKYCNLGGFAGIEPRPDVLWIRGADDQIVSDTSLFDFGYLGMVGAVPGWPGEEIYPPQPMVSQTRTVLERYRAAGGRYHEEVLPGCGHSPQIESPGEFMEILTAFLERRT